MKTGLLWNTCAKDLEFFRYSAARYTKFAKGGWDRAVCWVPTTDQELFAPVCDKHGIKLMFAEEWPGLGFNWHQFWQCQADLLLPDCDAIWHMDADCVFTAPCSYQDWMVAGKIVAPFYPFGHVKRKPEEFGPGMWKSRVDAALGGDVLLSTMTGHPHGHWSDVYRETRNRVELRQEISFDEYVRACVNEYPKGFCEFETLGAVAQGGFGARYFWIDLDYYAHPSKKFVEERWSHGGLDFVTSDRLDGVRSPRQLFADLGLIP